MEPIVSLSPGESKTRKCYDVDEYISILSEIANGMGEYAPHNSPSKGGEMLSILEDIESKSREIEDPNLYYYLAIGYDNYSAWYSSGEKRKEYLEKVVSLLNEALKIGPNHIQAKAELGSLLIEKRAIRNLDLGIKYLEELKNENKMPFYLEAVLAKALRQTGKFSLDENYDLSKLSIMPAVFDEERKRLRALVRKFKKEKDEEKLKKALNQLYNLAIYVVLCFHRHSCDSGVSGEVYEKAQRARRYVNKINHSFEEHGYIRYCRFFSGNDWKNFKKAFGDTNKMFDPYTLVDWPPPD